MSKLVSKLIQITTFIAVLAVLAAPAFSDTLVLKNGEKITGYFEGGSERVIKFRARDGMVKDYDLLSIQQIQFGEDKTMSTPNSSEPRLVPGTERVTRPASSNAANTGWT